MKHPASSSVLGRRPRLTTARMLFTRPQMLQTPPTRGGVWRRTLARASLASPRCHLSSPMLALPRSGARGLGAVARDGDVGVADNLPLSAAAVVAGAVAGRKRRDAALWA